MEIISTIILNIIAFRFIYKLFVAMAKHGNF